MSICDWSAVAEWSVTRHGALGGELGLGRAGQRLEPRDYVSRFEPLSGSGEDKTRTTSRSPPV